MRRLLLVGAVPAAVVLWVVVGYVTSAHASEASACQQLTIAAQQGSSLAGSTAVEQAYMVANSANAPFAAGVQILASNGTPTASEQSAIRSACGFGSDVVFQSGEVCRPSTGNC